MKVRKTAPSDNKRELFGLINDPTLAVIFSEHDELVDYRPKFIQRSI